MNRSLGRRDGEEDAARPTASSAWRYQGNLGGRWAALLGAVPGSIMARPGPAMATGVLVVAVVELLAGSDRPLWAGLGRGRRPGGGLLSRIGLGELLFLAGLEIDLGQLRGGFWG